MCVCARYRVFLSVFQKAATVSLVVVINENEPTGYAFRSIFSAQLVSISVCDLAAISHFSHISVVQMIMVSSVGINNKSILRRTHNGCKMLNVMNREIKGESE